MVIGSDKKQLYPLLVTIKNALNIVTIDVFSIIDMNNPFYPF